MATKVFQDALKRIKRFYFFLFSFIFVISQLFLNVFAINYIEQILVRQRLEQNQQLVRLALDAYRRSPNALEGSAAKRAFFNELTSKTYFGEDSFICAIDSKGYIMAHPEKERIGEYRGDQNLETSQGLRPFIGETYLVEGIWNNRKYSTIEIVSTLFDKDTNITVAAHQNKTLVDEKLTAIRLYFTLFSVLSLGALFGIGWFLTRKVVGRHVSQIEGYENELESFNYSVSHDLRAPLRRINGFSDALVEDYSDKLDDSGRSYLSRLRAASDRMGLLIDNLLHLSQVSRQEIIRADVNLSRLAEEVLSNLQRDDPERNVEIAVEPKVKTKGDAQLLRIVLENLLGNAWKYTSKNPTAHIEFGKSNVSGKKAFFVSDDGVGFDTKYLSKIFGPFQRLHSDHEFKGNGIGLATVQRIVHRHGGRVWAESTIEEGATFYFSIP